jgi:hypothetical protein
MDVVIQTPMGPQNFSIPVEEMAATAGKSAVEAAWPAVQEHIYEEIPIIVDRSLNAAQPRMRSEVDRAVNRVTLHGGIIAIGLASVVVLTGAWIRRAFPGR